MRVQVLKHVPFEGIGNMALWMHRHEAQVDYTRFYDDQSLPDCEQLDLVIIMGGPMSANDDNKLPWMKTEKAFIAEVIDRQIPLLGICLGAQLIANVLGAQISANTDKEIGWFDVKGVTSDKSEGFKFPQQSPMFHWHGETFDLPSGARLLASSEACTNQAFQYGKRAIGLQCHPETTPDSVDLLIGHSQHELVEGPYIQNEHQLRAATSETYQQLSVLMGNILDHLVRA